jgi:hypothetical protein
MTNTSTFGLIALLLLSSGSSPQQRPEAGSRVQVVFGYVFNQQQEAVAGATVCAIPKGAGEKFCSKAGPSGNYSIAVRKAGVYVISGMKEEDFYPDRWGNFYDPPHIDLPEVNITSDSGSPRLNITLGPKAGKIEGRFVNSVNGQSVPVVRVDICLKEGSKSCMSLKQTFPEGKFRFLVPDVPFSLKISEIDGYEDWYGPNGSKQDEESMRISPGESRELTVYLRPIVK